MKGELEGLVAVVASWLSGYGGYSQTPWVPVPQLPFFSLLLSRLTVYTCITLYNQFTVYTCITLYNQFTVYTCITLLLSSECKCVSYLLIFVHPMYVHTCVCVCNRSKEVVIKCFM